MSDEADLAQAEEALFLRVALSRRRKPEPGGPARTHCVDCGEEIPARRRAAIPGCVRCTGCQNHEDTVNHD